MTFQSKKVKQDTVEEGLSVLMELNSASNPTDSLFSFLNEFKSEPGSLLNTNTISAGLATLETVAQRQPMILPQALVLDLGNSIVNIGDKINKNEVRPSDITGLTNSVISVMGGFAGLSTLGSSGAAVAGVTSAAAIALPLGVALFCTGKVIDHYQEDISRWLGKEADRLFEQIDHTKSEFLNTQTKIKEVLGGKLYDMFSKPKEFLQTHSKELAKFYSIDEHQKWSFDWDALDLGESLKLNLNYDQVLDELTQCIKPIWSAHVLDPIQSELSTEINHSQHSMSMPLENSQRKMVFDFRETNLKVIYENLSDIYGDPLVLHDIENGFVTHILPADPYVLYVETPNGLIRLDVNGESRGVTYPIIYNGETGKVLTVPVDANGGFSQTNTAQALIEQPEQFEHSSHLNYNYALQGILDYQNMHSISKFIMNKINHQMSAHSLEVQDIMIEKAAHNSPTSLPEVVKEGTSGVMGETTDDGFLVKVTVESSGNLGSGESNGLKEPINDEPKDFKVRGGICRVEFQNPDTGALDAHMVQLGNGENTLVENNDSTYYDRSSFEVYEAKFEYL